jgi:hypothetical protein
MGADKSRVIGVSAARELATLLRGLLPLRANLLAEIRQALGQAVSPSLTTQSDVSDIYEGYIFGILLNAARIEGAQVSLSSIQEATPTQFVFRTSPGYLNLVEIANVDELRRAADGLNTLAFCVKGQPQRLLRLATPIQSQQDCSAMAASVAQPDKPFPSRE